MIMFVVAGEESVMEANSTAKVTSKFMNVSLNWHHMACAVAFLIF